MRAFGCFYGLSTSSTSHPSSTKPSSIGPHDPEDKMNNPKPEGVDAHKLSKARVRESRSSLLGELDALASLIAFASCSGWPTAKLYTWTIRPRPALRVSGVLGQHWSLNDSRPLLHFLQETGSI